VELLIEFGASLESQDVFGQTLAQIARQPQPREVEPSSNSDFPFTWAAMSYQQPIHPQTVFGCQLMPAEANEAWIREVAAGWQMPVKPSMPAKPNKDGKREVALWEMPAEPNEGWKREVAAEWEM